MIEVVLLTLSIFAYAFCTLDPVCNQTPIDQGDSESIQIAQLNAIRCQILVLERNHAAAMEAITSVHNKTMFMQQNILDTIKTITSNYSIIQVIQWCLFSLVFAWLSKLLFSCVWFYVVQKSDRIAEFLMLLSNLKARWWNSALPTYDTVDQYRDSRPVPTLLVIIRCCGCKKLTVRTESLEMRSRRQDI